jgi:phage gp46-like protein
MDFALAKSGPDLGAMTFDKATDLYNNVYLSLMISRGSWFANPAFGSRFHLLKKNVPRAAALAEEYAREALQWLLDTGRARKIEVNAERDPGQDLNRLKLEVRVTAKDGRPLVFERFIEVV